VEIIDLMVSNGGASTRIERHLRSLGTPIKAETITRHKRVCLGINDLVPRPARAVAAQVGSVKQVETDFATAVQKEALKLLEEGGMKITAKDGLGAQKLLDDREAKQKDREFVMNLARLLSGAGQALPDDMIDGEFTDVSETALLAPPEMRE
jgi:hypothetical protein